MTDEALTPEPTPAPEPSPEPTPEPTPEPERAKPEGWEPVDFEKDPPDKIKQRFNRLYAQVKQGGEVAREMARNMRQLHDRLQKFETDSAETQRNKAITEAQDALAEAQEQGDFKRAAQLQTFIAQKVAEPKPQPKKAPEVPDDDARVISMWGGERDPEGGFKRPWVQKGHPEYAKAIQTAADVFEAPEFGHLNPLEKLAEVERRMAPRKPKAAPVIGGDGNYRPGTKQELSEAQKSVARRMFPDLKVGDAYTAYAEGLK